MEYSKFIELHCAMNKKAADTMEQLARDFAYGTKWHDYDADRELQSHLDEYAETGEHKNLVDAAIIARIRSAIDRRRSDELLKRYNQEAGQPYASILAKRLARFRDYQNIPFPADK